MEVVDLVCGDRRSLKYGESSVAEDGLMRLTARPVFTGHIAVVGGRSSPGEAIAFVVRAHAVKAIASCQLSAEVIDV